MPVSPKLFTAISDPRRRAILEYLKEGGKNAGEIAQKFEVSWPAISRHLRILKTAGLIWEMRAGRNRFYELNPGGLLGALTWFSQFGPSPSPTPLQGRTIQQAVGREYTS